MFLAIVIYYLGHYDEKFGFDLICDNNCGNLTCGELTCGEIPKDVCGDCVCGDCVCAPEFPEDLNVNFVNESEW